MDKKPTKSLRAAHPDTPEPSPDSVRPAAPLNAVIKAYTDKHPLLKDIPSHFIRDAWFTTAHMMLKPGAKVADMGCHDGIMTYVMAALNPHMTFVGVDADKKAITKAQEKFVLPNLSFQTGNIARNAGFNAGIKSDELDGIINSFTLHEVFSDSKYDDRPVVHALENQFALLKPEGLMFIRDFAMPERGEYVQIEMPDKPSTGESLEDLSEADLLVWYSEHARPKEDPGCHGFFLEELPPRFPNTRLFRLPAKWAYEFIMRKDDRDAWEAELPKEYTFFTQHEYRKNLRALGARVLYTTPHWDDAFIKRSFTGRFRLLDDDGRLMGPPPTSFIAVAQKMTERVSLRLHERRPSQNTVGKVRVNAFRNDIDGRLIDVVSRDVELAEIIPYRVTGEGRLYVFVHEGLPRGIVNAVPRQARNLDEKGWSGHMIEAIAVDSHVVSGIAPDNVRDAAVFARDYLGLKPAIGGTLENGPVSYPAPDYIDERISTRYLRIEDREHKPMEPRFVSPDIEGFSGRGRLREMDAQSILNAIAVGYLPNARLETQILALADALGLELESWHDCPLVLPEEEPPEGAITDLKAIVAQMAGSDSRYRNSRGTAGQIRTVQSIFVDEGRIEGGLRGLKSRDMEFVIADDGATNIAAVLPMNRHAVSKEMMVGLIADFLPVPQRHKGNGMTVRVPTFALPRDIKNMDEARAFIADKFKVKPELVAKLGESYFTHAGITPQRVFPFAVAGMGILGKGRSGGVTMCAPIRRIRRLMFWDFDDTMMWMTQRAMLTMGDDSDFSFDRTYRQDMKKMLMEGKGAKTMALSDYGASWSSDTSASSGSSSGGGFATDATMTDALFGGDKAAEKPAETETRAQEPAEVRKRRLNPK
jgi:SAM-dependent methyltransferase